MSRLLQGYVQCASTDHKPPLTCLTHWVGVRHDGTPSGKLHSYVGSRCSRLIHAGSIDHIAGVECYTAEPTGEQIPEKAILFLTDAYGHKFVNNQVRRPFS